MSPSSTRSTRMASAAGAKVCGAQLGFRRGDHCRVIADPGQPHCSGHLNAAACWTILIPLAAYRGLL